MNEKKRKLNVKSEYEKNDKISKTSLNEDSIKTIDDGLKFLKSLFPYEMFQKKLPAIIWKHQLYALIDDRTTVDREVHKLIEKGDLRTFVMGSTMANNEITLCFTSEYKDILEKLLSKPLFVKFWNVLSNCKEAKFVKEDLIEEYSLNETNIKELIRLGVLSLHRNVGYYILSIPSCGEFSKYFEIGRKAVLNIVKKSKFREILKDQLEKRKLPYDVKLPIQYHITDIIGSDKVQCISSPTGLILRYLD